jgi:hypothetical protein
VSFVGESRVDVGEFGYFGFPIIALIYAFYRRTSDTKKLLKSLENKQHIFESDR